MSSSRVAVTILGQEDKACQCVLLVPPSFASELSQKPR
jgi:hypothetical protein